MNVHRLAVRACRVVSADGDVDTTHTVQCPRRGRSASFRRCCGCSERTSIEVDPGGLHGIVECTAGDMDLPNGRVDVAEAAVRIPVGTLIGLETTCVDQDTPVAVIRDLILESGQRAVPVVDDGRRLVGIVSKTDLLTHDLATPQLRAAGIMTHVVHALPEEAPVSYAISLMAFEKLQEIPIVGSDNRFLGLVTAADALRWVARAMGYVEPERASTRDV